MKPIVLTPGQRREIERRRKGTLYSVITDDGT
jgi:hypothetical protein